MDSGIGPTTSNHIFLPPKDNQNNELDILMKKCKEREGEVTILRNQVRELKIRFGNEQQQLEKEWKSKISIKEKQVLSVSSELEFKVSRIIDVDNLFKELQHPFLKHKYL